MRRAGYIDETTNGTPLRRREAEAARAQWLARDAREDEVRLAFRQMPLEEALSLLAVARRNIEIAAKELNQRLSEDTENETCTTCGGPPPKNGIFVMQGSEKGEDSLLHPYRYCSVACVRERNRKKMLPVGAPTHRLDGHEEGDIR